MTLLKLTRNGLSPALEEPLEEATLADWRANRPAHAGATALVIANDALLDDVAKDLAGFSTIILEFPAFKDGRAFSQARLLRERYRFTGEIRARGEILHDQLLFMVRCGFDAFEFAGEDASVASDALGDFSFAYQAAADGADPVWRHRQARAAAA